MVEESTTVERRELLRRRAASSEQRVMIPSADSYAARPVVEVPIGLPIYRADNGRLAVVLSEQTRGQGLAPDHFSRRQESPEVQRLLHEQLLALARDPAGPIFQELERTAVQTEPLLATADGVVVNGNRRLAAMRALFGQDADRFADFAEVRVAVLPEAMGPTELESIEATLQMAPETKLAYGWLARRLTLRRHRDVVGLTTDEICQSYRLAGPGQIAAELAELDLAETYLADYLGHPAEYGRLEDAEPYFVGLAKTLRGLPPVERQTWRFAGFAMIRHAKALRIQAERYYPFAAANPPYGPALALLRFGNDEQLWPERQAEEETEPPSQAEHRRLQRPLSELDRSEQNARALVAQLDQVLAEHRERQLISPRELVKKTQHLNRQLAKLDPAALPDGQRRELLGVLAETQFHADQLLRGRKSKGLEKRVTDLVGKLYYLRRRALLESKR